MNEKREAARLQVTKERSAAATRAGMNDLIAALRQLGFRAGEVRGAASLCVGIPDAPLEERVRLALSYFHRPRGGPIPVR